MAINQQFYRLSFYMMFLVCCMVGSSAYGQQAEEEENEYFEAFEEELISRFYFSRKYVALGIHDQEQDQYYRYEPNSTLNMGVGATWKWLTLNLALGWPFLNPDRGQGHTRYLDLQAHAYPKKFIIDFFGEFYEGYHLLPQGTLVPPGENYYTRPDMVVTKIGANVQYLFNYDKLSLRASFLQNEWQKKSAGSFLLGFEMYGGRAIDDTALLPLRVLGDESRNFRTMRFFDFGPNAGYAYTWVIKERFFVTAVASASLGAGYSFLEGEAPGDRNTEWGISPNVFLRGFAGYNYKKWSLNVNYVHNRVRLVPNQGFSSSVMTGNYRLNLIYRFVPGPSLKKRLNIVDIVDF